MRYTASHWGAYQFDGDGLAPIADDPSPARIGRGWLSAARDRNSRILTPAIRDGWLAGDGGAGRGRDGFVAVSWDRAAALAAQELARVRETHGNGAIFAGSYGWASAGRFHHAQSQLRRFLNLCGGFVSARDTYSHAAAEVLFPHVLGLSNRAVQDGQTSWPLVAEHCSLLVAFGGISPRTAQINSSGTAGHEVAHWLGQMRARVVNVSPQESDYPGADWWAIRPGTDTALILALAHTLWAEGLQDDAFLTRCTSGWPEFRDYLCGAADGVAKTADWAAPICDLPAARIRALARDMAAHRTMIALNWGMQRADHGEQPLWAGLALAAMLGRIGQPGTGFAFGYGSTTAVGRPAKLYDWPSLPQGRNPVADFIPVARIADMLEQPGAPYRYNLTDRTYPDIRLVWWAGGNPFHHHQDLFRLERAWRRPETVIVQDHSWTATARRADIVLPATTPLERDDLMLSRRDPSLIYMSQRMDRVGMALDDHEILRRIGAELGVAEAFTEGRTAEGWLRWLWDGAIAQAAQHGVTLPGFDHFRQMGRFDMPDAAEARVFLRDFAADPDLHPLPSESGKITLFNRAIARANLPDCPGHPAWMPPFESLLTAPEGMLHLISGQPDTRLHSQNDRGCESQSDKIAGREACYLHPDTARAAGLAEGAVVKLWNARGACLAGLRLTSGIRPDCVALPTGAWFDPDKTGPDETGLERAGNPNALTRDVGCSSLSQGNSAHTTLVRVSAWDGALPPLSIDQPPPIRGA
ncbi:MAG: biotin/methionine sulfoxide reductase BisC [Roseibaca calidilacus]|uniref:Biotin/methionine sulfoxide reductase n=1 Tax=Roseibaca calidilacus TaxID=1666912 RepID=A0A0P7WTV1_9RHOB|nr:molybdopterin-dependent oxidoreductase [Roseibaca calidilacus]KPP90863.1 MAG: biotin/methionine sulfoxide reductase BisC [Roseibaca calidilacus]CUX83697.1 biotin/methionine sulfoxide reductase [Roseibaca calidilacus]